MSSQRNFIVFTLPYIPNPYPDEILGSWLARCALHNGSGAWRVALESAGIGPKQQSPFFNHVDFTPEFEALLKALQTKYDVAITNLSTVPYFSALSGAENTRVPGATNFLMPTSVNRPAQSLVNLRRPLIPWFCPLCTLDDLARCGETYWHRSHQLPTLCYCHLHSTPLLQECPNCHAAARGGDKAKILFPALRCRCGFFFHKAISHRRVPKIFRDLSDVSIDALSQTSVDWTRKELNAYLTEQIRSYEKFHGYSIATVLRERFPNAMVGRFAVKVQPPSSAKLMIFYVDGVQRSSLTNAALIAALEDSLPSMIKAFHLSPRFLKAEEPCVTLAVDFDHLTVKVARQNLLRRIQATGKSGSQYGVVYWFLRIHDADWLKRQRHCRFRKDLPTIEEDRESITGLGTSVEKGKVGPNCPAILRARVRDRQWLSLFYQGRKNARSYDRSDQALRRQKRESQALYRALNEIVESEKRPVRITYGLLGSRIGLTYLQTMLRVKEDPELRSYIAKANSTKIERQLQWAVRTLQNEGADLNTTAVFKKARLPSAPKTLAFVKQLLLRIGD